MIVAAARHWPAAALARVGASRNFAALFAAALGLVIVFGAGFAPSDAAHHAAHDARHSFAFPCH